MGAKDVWQGPLMANAQTSAFHAFLKQLEAVQKALPTQTVLALQNPWEPNLQVVVACKAQCHSAVWTVAPAALAPGDTYDMCIKHIMLMAGDVALEHAKDTHVIWQNLFKDKLVLKDKSPDWKGQFWKPDTAAPFLTLESPLKTPLDPHPLAAVTPWKEEESMAGYSRRERDEEEITDLGDECIVRHVTAKALLVDIEGEEHWIPKSVTREGTTVEAIGDSGTLVVAQWFAKKAGLL